MRILAIVVLALSACAAPPAGAVPTPTPNRTPATVSGIGQGNSGPVDLAGSYAVAWTAQAGSSIGCFHGATLRTANEQAAGTLVGLTLNDGAPHSGSGYVYGLAAGQYHVRVITGCQAWSFTFTPQ